jgi:hypothetical protein
MWVDEIGEEEGSVRGQEGTGRKGQVFVYF